MLLLVAACGGVANADDGIEVIGDEIATLAPDETERNEQVQQVEVSVVGDDGLDDKEKVPREEVTKPEPQDSEPAKDEKVAKDGVTDKVEDSTADVGEPLKQTRAAVTLTAYGNVSPTNQYAVYSSGLLREVPLDGHYVFVQDSAQSYTFVVGKGDSLSSLTDARWWRWYNAGVNVGWVLERGSGSVVVRPGAYTVLSDLNGYPSLQDSGTEQIRREVMLYALVFAVAHVLRSVWSYELRGAKRGIG